MPAALTVSGGQQRRLRQLVCVSLTASSSRAFCADLHIDAEGFDFEVVKASRIEVTQPRVIRLEAQHIDVDGCVLYLNERGYHTVRFRANGVSEILAILTRPGGKLIVAAAAAAPALNCSARAFPAVAPRFYR